MSDSATSGAARAKQRITTTTEKFDRREFIKNAAAGTALVALGGALYRIAADDLTRQARAENRADGKKRLPPGQKVIEKLRDVSVAARTIQRDQEPDDVVGAVVYLAGPSASFVTGQTIVIDGGQYFH